MGYGDSVVSKTRSLNCPQSPDYVVGDRFYPDQTNFIIASSRPGDGSTPEHRAHRAHPPTYGHLLRVRQM